MIFGFFSAMKTMKNIRKSMFYSYSYNQIMKNNDDYNQIMKNNDDYNRSIIIEKISFVYDKDEMIEILNQIATFIKKENKKVKYLNFDSLEESIKIIKEDNTEEWRIRGFGIAEINLFDELGNKIKENPNLIKTICDYLQDIVRKANNKFQLRNANILLDELYDDKNRWSIYIIAGDL